MENNIDYSYLNITGASSVVLATGRTMLRSIVVNATSGSITVVNGTTGTTAVVATISGTPGEYRYDIALSTGLRISTVNGTTNITAVYGQP
jgi:hypothetical protein